MFCMLWLYLNRPTRSRVYGRHVCSFCPWYYRIAALLTAAPHGENFAFIRYLLCVSIFAASSSSCWSSGQVTIDAEELAEMQIHEAALRQRPKLGLRRSPDTALGGTGGGDALIPMTAALQDVQEGLGDHSPGTEVINLGQPSRYILSSCGFGVHCGKSPTDDVDGEEKGDSLTVMEGGGAEGLEVTAVVVGQEEGAGKREEERMGRERYEGRHKTTPLWQVAAILLSRAGKGGYAM